MEREAMGLTLSKRVEKILLDIEIVEPLQDDAYEALDQLIGLCTTKHTDASLNHDAIIYRTKKQR